MMGLLSCAMFAGCLSDEEVTSRILRAARESRNLVQRGDTLRALQYAQDAAMSLPRARSAEDSSYYGWLYARLAFLYYYAPDDARALSDSYYRAGYPYLRHLPDTTRIDVLRWTALVLAGRGDTTRALVYLSESRIRAVWLRDSLRTARADVCLSYLAPREIVAHSAATASVPLSGVIVVLFVTVVLILSLLLAVPLPRRPVVEPIRFPLSADEMPANGHELSSQRGKDDD